jgi:hypothetical protein
MTSPVKLPNDGPFNFVSLQSRDQDNQTSFNIHYSVDGLTHHDQGYFEKAVKLLTSCSATTTKNDDDTSSFTFLANITHKMLNTVLTAQTLREQEASLRAYRSTLLNIRKDLEVTTTSKNMNEETLSTLNLTPTTNKLNHYDLDLFLTTYRILLEWGVSHETSHGIKKACLSCLSTLKLFIIDNSTDDDDHHHKKASQVDHIHVSTIRSLLHSSPSSQQQVWYNPIQSLFEILSYNPTLQTIISSPTLISSTLKLIQDYSQECTKILTEYSFSTTNTTTEGNKNNNDNNSFTTIISSENQQKQSGVGIVSKQVTESLARATDLCSTTKLLLFTLQQKTQLPSVLTVTNADTFTTTTTLNDNTNNNSMNNFQASIVQGSTKEFLDEIQILLHGIKNHLLVPLITCSVTSSDTLCICGVTFGLLQLHIWQNHLGDSLDSNNNNNNISSIVMDLHEFLRNIISTNDIHDDYKKEHVFDSNHQKQNYTSLWDDEFGSLPLLNKLAVVRGILASMTDEILTQPIQIKSKSNFSSEDKEISSTSSSLLINPISYYILHLAEHSTENAVRHSALKGLDSVLARCKSIILSSTTFNTSTHPDQEKALFVTQVQELSNQILNVTLCTWESPPSRQIESSLPELFQNLIQVLETIQQNEHNDAIDCLIQRVLSQHAQRKGRYVALDILLPKIGAMKLIELSSDSVSTDNNAGKCSLITSLIDSIGDRGSNTNVIANLLSKILNKLREELDCNTNIQSLDNSHKNTTIINNRKARRKKERELRKQQHVMKGFEENKNNADGIITDSLIEQEEDVCRLNPEWIKTWCPPLARALLSTILTRRNQVAAHCLPLITYIVGGPSQRINACHAFSFLVDEIQVQEKVLQSESKCTDFSSDCRPTDISLWALLQVAWHAEAQKLINTIPSSLTLLTSISTNLSIERMKFALTHQNEGVRLVAFQALDAVLATHRKIEKLQPIQSVEVEINMWKESFPYAFKSSSKEYISELLLCYSSLLEKLFILLDQEKRLNEYGELNHLENLLSTFIIDFVLNDVFVLQGAYPGTVTEKELVIMCLLECTIKFIFVYEGEDHLLSQMKYGTAKTKSNKGPRRRVSELQLKWCDKIMKTLLSETIFATLISCMNSLWDSTRDFAFGLICTLSSYARKKCKRLPQFLLDQHQSSLMLSRAIHLASSPRQREADTGARLIAVHFASLLQQQQNAYLSDFVRIVNERLSLMENGLNSLLYSKAIDSKSDEIDSTLQNTENNSLPLAHGLIQALRFVVDVLGNENYTKSDDVLLAILENVAITCCRAITMSLKVVADTKDKDAEIDTCTKNESSCDINIDRKSAPLNVNTGAIGANAIFASVKARDKDDEERRFATQRVVVGTWLLIRDSCSTLSSVLSLMENKSSSLILAEAGTLLINTMTSLKHQGAAFASHKTLQTLCGIVFNKEGSQTLPSIWAQRLLDEISFVENVRDSTLRRSTGYGLGFLSILRSEGSDNKILVPYVLANLLKLSLPSESCVNELMKSLKLTAEDDMFVFTPILRRHHIGIFAADTNYQWRTRVHALNVIRLIILDSPMTADMRPFVGDAIIAAIAGYKDESWAVRNSSTMTAAAAMLRVINADKNADALRNNNKKDHVNGNAVTARELFRSYPSLATYMLATIKESSKSYQRNELSSLFPLLLLLSRLQPASSLSVDASADKFSNLFINHVIDCLGHFEHKIRIMASRALAVLCTGDEDKSQVNTSRSALISRLLDTSCLRSFSNLSTVLSDSNLEHGVLLGIKSLLTTAPAPEPLFKGKLCDTIAFYASWGNGSCSCPPLCTVAALETWMLVNQKHRNSHLVFFNNYLITIDVASSFTIHLIENLIQQQNVPINGLAALGACASKISCEWYTSCIYNSHTSISNKNIYFHKLSRLFNSPCYDVRLQAVKSFKKNHYNYMVKIIHDTHLTVDEKRDMISSINHILFTSLQLEMSRDDIIGPHPPTLRRLTRCIIESITTYVNLSGNESEPFSDWSMTSEISLDGFWEICVDLWFKGGGRDHNLDNLQTYPDDDIDVLAANALELMAFILSLQMFDDTDDTVKTNALHKRIEFFVQSSEFLTNPRSSWRVRHGVSTAAGVCKLLSPGNVMPTVKSHNDRPDVKEYQLRLFINTLSLLQDNDQDVRQSAAIALSSDTNKGVSTSLMVLLETYESICTHWQGQYDESALVYLFMKQIEKECIGIEGDITTLYKEYNCSLRVRNNPNENLNLKTNRKIFEEEDPNPFEEPLVTMQVAIKAVMSNNYHVELNEVTRRIFNLLQLRCELILEKILNQTLSYERIDLCHNITWHGNIMPRLQGLILATTIGIFFAVNENDNCKKLASSLVGLSTWQMHPCIHNSLECLSHASEGDHNTRLEIIRNCFLIPQNHVK